MLIRRAVYALEPLDQQDYQIKSEHGARGSKIANSLHEMKRMLFLIQYHIMSTGIRFCLWSSITDR